MDSNKGNQSLLKALQIIEVMAVNKAPMRLLDISKAVSISPSTVLRFLNTFKAMNYVNQDPASLNYFPTMKFQMIANMVNSQLKIRDITHPFLLDISQKTGEFSSLAVLEEMEVIYIDYADGPNSTYKNLMRIGKNAPAHSTGVGKCLLLNFTEAEIDLLISEKGLIRLTEKTITTKEKLLEELKTVRKNGFAFDDEECEPNFKCIAVPLRDYSGNVIASMSVSTPTVRLTGQKEEFILELLNNASGKISATMGYSKTQ